MQFGDLNMLLTCVFQCDFSVVSDDIWHCSGVVWLLFVYKNDRKSCDFAVKTLCFIWFFMVSIRLLTGKMGLYVECVT